MQIESRRHRERESEREIGFVKPRQYGLFSLLSVTVGSATVTRATAEEISDVGPYYLLSSDVNY